jgi:hypothetical protein
MSSSAAEIALGENVTFLNRYDFGRMLLAVITAAGHTFFACFSFHPGFTSLPAQVAHLIVSCGVLGAQVKPKAETKASTNDSNVFALPTVRILL